MPAGHFFLRQKSGGGGQQHNSQYHDPTSSSPSCAVAQLVYTYICWLCWLPQVATMPQAAIQALPNRGFAKAGPHELSPQTLHHLTQATGRKVPPGRVGHAARNQVWGQRGVGGWPSTGVAWAGGRERVGQGKTAHYAYWLDGAQSSQCLTVTTCP